VERARLYDLPDAPPPIGIAASGSSSVKLAASHGDALIPVCYDRDEKAARARARELWRWAVPGWHVMAELPDPRAFDAASGAVREEDVTALVPCGPDVDS
jgi:alkanesulfonate monooxygenase SsuD/methylene tetrahydromethanopterin reductase-like flavin-dependent oxidoreductase (luciferase family)